MRRNWVLVYVCSRCGVARDYGALIPGCAHTYKRRRLLSADSVEREREEQHEALRAAVTRIGELEAERDAASRPGAIDGWRERAETAEAQVKVLLAHEDGLLKVNIGHQRELGRLKEGIREAAKLVDSVRLCSDTVLREASPHVAERHMAAESWLAAYWPMPEPREAESRALAEGVTEMQIERAKRAWEYGPQAVSPLSSNLLSIGIHQGQMEATISSPDGNESWGEALPADVTDAAIRRLLVAALQQGEDT